MDIQKELSQISWQVDEPTYRNDPALSYSTLSTYESLGFNGLDHLFDKKDSPSLLVGSAVDAILTGGEDEFNAHFYVAGIPSIGDKEKLVADYIFENYGSNYQNLEDIPATYVLEAANTYEFQKNWKDETRVKVLTERCTQYYGVKHDSIGKTIIDLATFEDIKNMVKALKESPATCGYFAENDELSPIRRYYQLKFKFTVDNVAYRSMAD